VSRSRPGGGGGHGTVAFSAALVEVADQQVGTAGIAQLPDLVQEVSDRDGRVVGPASAQGGPVAWGDAIGGRFGDAGVALDGVQGEVQSAGAVEQADAGVEEGVDSVPALAGSLLADAAGPGRVDGGPAGRVGPHFGQDLVAQVPPQMPSVADLHRVGHRPADRLGICGRAVPAHDFDPFLPAQPCLQCGGLAVGQDIDAFPGLSVDDDRGVAVAAAQGEVVDPDHPWDAHCRRGDAPQQAQGGGVGEGRGQERGETGGRPAA
jgi:hypothetical protein